jgi:hypothetical protein
MRHLDGTLWQENAMRTARTKAALFVTVLAVSTVAAGSLSGASIPNRNTGDTAATHSSTTVVSVTTPVDYSTDEYFDM